MAKQHGLPWWAWIPFLPVLLALLLLWKLRRPRPVEPPIVVHNRSIALPAVELHATAAQAAPAALRSDDLTVVKGIGQKSAAALRAAGIYTFAQLAAASPDALKRILLEANLRLPDPTSWPAQAASYLE